ncbi:MAG: TetR/AcrR family transcriptional regulator [Aquamicrobium sp.]|uniref:TetR/AcrR family transcriptional regulator n=1 Tax=Aquamicrobium sp. TaxID=1872579 RepID=UPI00349E777F|nr:TetR/AcrR family transcriptional regulator [Aquamicrobium sp.]
MAGNDGKGGTGRGGAWQEREARIFAAAHALIAERGYGATSMLAVAKAAKVSNETLYRRYGDKRGLFARMVEDNARAIRAMLEAAVAGEGDALAGLRGVAPLLLGMLLGERAVSLNRAAAADETGELGRALAAGGRDAVAPLLGALAGRAMEAGSIRAPSAAQAVEWYIALLIGDMQVRRVTRVAAEPSEAEIEARAQAAFSAFLRLCAAG